MVGMCGLRRRRKEARPSEILDAAFDVFATNGFAGTRLDDIASRAGITKGTIYLYFGSKEDLFVATLREMTDPALENLTALMTAPKGPAIDILRENLAFAADLMVSDRRRRDVLRILMAEGARFPTLVDRWHADAVAPCCAAFQSVIDYGVARGEFRASAARDFPQLILAPIILANNWLIMFDERHPLDIRRFFDVALDVLVHGLAARPEMDPSGNRG